MEPIYQLQIMFNKSQITKETLEKIAGAYIRNKDKMELTVYEKKGDIFLLSVKGNFEDIDFL